MSAGLASQFIVTTKTYGDPVALAAKQRTEVMAAVASGHMVEADPDVVDAPLVQEPWATDDDDEEPRFRPANDGEDPTHWARTLTFARAASDGRDDAWVDTHMADTGDADMESWDNALWVEDALQRTARGMGLLPGHVDALVAEAKTNHRDRRLGPHSRACGIRQHEHGVGCSTNCPTCAGKQ